MTSRRETSCRGGAEEAGKESLLLGLRRREGDRMRVEQGESDRVRNDKIMEG